MKTAITVCMCFFAWGTWSQSDCELTDSVFYYKDVSKWEEAFDHAFGFVQGPKTFSGILMQAMHYQYPLTNVRIYFTLDEPIFNTTPGLVLVTYPQDECQTDNPGLVLTASNAQGSGRLMPLDAELQEKMENWKIVMDSEEMSGYDTTYGYNYLWEHLLEACQGGTSDLSVIYGISNINAENNKKSAIHIYLTSSNPVQIEKKYLDFSRPCPQLCGSLSSLIDIEDFNLNGDKE